MKRFLIIPLIMLAMLWVFTPGCEPDDPEDPFPPPNIEHDFGEMTDPRDGQTYKTIEIGTQTWMAENLNYQTGINWCYNNDPHKCDIYGRLYIWETAKTACPPGWRLPREAEWRTLTDYLGDNAGGKMKSTTLWNSPNTGATNESGWSGLPGGRHHRSSFLGDYSRDLGSSGFWWSASGIHAYSSRGWSLNYDSGDVHRRFGDAEIGFSVRCLK